MNRNINELSNTKYTLDDAFEIIKSSLGDSYRIINSIIISQNQEYETIINSMNNDIGILNKKIEQLKEENNQLKGTILQLQNKLLTLSNNLKQLSKDDQNDIKKIETKYYNIKQKHLNKNKDKVDKIKIDIKKNSDNNIFRNFENENNNINDEILKSNMYTIDIGQIQKSINQQLFNKKFKMKKEKTYTKGFNTAYKDSTPTRVIQKDNNLYIKENESQSSKSLENNNNQKQIKTISNISHKRKTYNNFILKNNVIQNEPNPKDKFNLIAKRIRHLKNGLSINNLDSANNENNIRYNTTTVSFNRRNYSNINNTNFFEN